MKKKQKIIDWNNYDNNREKISKKLNELISDGYEIQQVIPTAYDDDPLDYLREAVIIVTETKP